MVACFCGLGLPKYEVMVRKLLFSSKSYNIVRTEDPSKGLEIGKMNW
jgi:hypothetical protein